jgi:uncharacterized protein YlxP (DUF503 family)
MHIGILTLYLSIGGADSLKDKRQAIRSLTARLRERFNVSASEVGDLDIWRRATVGVAVVTNDSRFANQVLSQVVNHVENDPRAQLEDYTLEIIAAGENMTSAAALDSEPDVSDWFPG